MAELGEDPILRAVSSSGVGLPEVPREIDASARTLSGVDGPAGGKPGGLWALSSRYVARNSGSMPKNGKQLPGPGRGPTPQMNSRTLERYRWRR